MMSNAEIFVESNSAPRDEHSRNYKCISTANALKALEIQKQEDLGISSESQDISVSHLLSVIDIAYSSMQNMLCICQTSVECENCPMHAGGRCSYKQTIETLKQTLKQTLNREHNATGTDSHMD